MEVYRFTTGSYLEDQDMWGLSGIFRNVTLWSSPQEHTRDFYIDPDLDAQYKDATIHASAWVKNYSKSPVAAKTLTVVLYEGDKAVKGSTGAVAVPTLKPGEEVKVRLGIPVQDPKKWTAETLNLYTTVLTLSATGLSTVVPPVRSLWPLCTLGNECGSGDSNFRAALKANIPISWVDVSGNGRIRVYIIVVTRNIPLRHSAAASANIPTIIISFIRQWYFQTGHSSRTILN